MKKNLFHCHKNPISVNIDINKLTVFNKVSFGKKGFNNFIGYRDNEKVKPLCIMLPKVSGYTQKFNETIYVFFDKRW